MYTSMLFDKLCGHKTTWECVQQLHLYFSYQRMENFEHFLVCNRALGDGGVKDETNAWLPGNGEEYDAF